MQKPTEMTILVDSENIWILTLILKEIPLVDTSTITYWKRYSENISLNNTYTYIHIICKQVGNFLNAGQGLQLVPPDGYSRTSTQGTLGYNPWQNRMGQQS